MSRGLGMRPSASPLVVGSVDLNYAARTGFTVYAKTAGISMKDKKMLGLRPGAFMFKFGCVYAPGKDESRMDENIRDSEKRGYKNINIIGNDKLAGEQAKYFEHVCFGDRVPSIKDLYEQHGLNGKGKHVEERVVDCENSKTRTKVDDLLEYFPEVRGRYGDCKDFAKKIIKAIGGEDLTEEKIDIIFKTSKKRYSRLQFETNQNKWEQELAKHEIEKVEEEEKFKQRAYARRGKRERRRREEEEQTMEARNRQRGTKKHKA